MISSQYFFKGNTLKRILSTVLIVVLCLAASFSGLGCEEFEFACAGGDYINVAVSASIHAQVSEGVLTEPWAGVLLEIQLVKAGGEREVFNLTTNANGDITEQCQATFKVYKQQMVDVNIKPISGVLPISMGGEIWDPVKHYYYLPFGKNRLNWEDLDGVGWGETYYWSPSVTIELRLI